MKIPRLASRIFHKEQVRKLSIKLSVTEADFLVRWDPEQKGAMEYSLPTTSNTNILLYKFPLNGLT